MMEATRPSESSVLTRGTGRDIPEDGIVHSHRRENLKSYVALGGWPLWRRHVLCEVRTRFLCPTGRHSS
jgi:hypothetical protein